MRDNLAGMTQTGRFSITVPATSANLGPGFDTLGIAVALPLRVEATESDTDRFLYEGEGSLPDTPKNLMHQGFALVCRELGLEPVPVEFRVNSSIPLARGLGSSSAALVAGAAAADALTGNRLGRDGVFQICARAEGHPDNVAPAVFGGFTASAATDQGFVTRSLPLPATWRFLFAVPEFELPTMTARKLVPDSYSRSDTVFTSSRTALWTLAVATEDAALLAIACQDVMHEPQRMPMLPGFQEAVSRAEAAGAHGTFLSGAGPTLAAICASDTVDAVSEALAGYGRVLELPGSPGYRIT